MNRAIIPRAGGPLHGPFGLLPGRSAVTRLISRVRNARETLGEPQNWAG